MQSREYDRMRAVEDAHWWYAVLRGQVLREMHARVKPGSQVLDAGCGTGGMLALLDHWQSAGIDASALAVQHCQDRGLRDVRLGSVNGLPFEAASFDAVLCLDVLYHEAVDERRALSEMARVLRPGGTLIVNLPAFECLRGAHDEAVCGVRRYSSFQVRRLLGHPSLGVVKIWYWNAWLFAPLWLRRRQPHAESSDLTMPPRWLNAAMAWMGRLDAWCCRHGRVPFGTSVFAVARKL